MSKTYKDNKEKWRKNRDFQKKQQKKHGFRPEREEEPKPFTRPEDFYNL